MVQKSSSNLLPLPEDTVKRQYSEESEEEDKTESIQASHSWPTLPSHVRHEELPSSPTPLPRETYTPETESRLQLHQRREFLSTPTKPSTLQQQIPRKEITVEKTKAKDYKLNLNGEKLEKFIRKLGRKSQNEGDNGGDLAMEMAFWTKYPRISDAIEEIKGHEEGNWSQLKKDLITK
ncbi:hypothetical protein O181_011357 [Austropuccinia psidii MF-1]|uniref:Uncharacterized protein n=1 Tax=Austropuccinia psidii MF-1 TaxID=1389203 RepID=A0A9Q3GM15_9BASI|nr:hypothetical protein [Austropuccinia psidii MF-1]